VEDIIRGLVVVAVGCGLRAAGRLHNLGSK